MEDPEDEMCIAALFEEEPKVQGPNAAGNTSSKSGEASTGDSTVNDALVSVEDISLGKLFGRPTKADSDTFKRLQEALASSVTPEDSTSEEDGGSQLARTIQDSFAVSPRAVCLAGAHASLTIGDAKVLSGVLRKTIGREAFLNPCYAFVDSALKELVRAFRFSDLEAVVTNLSPHVLEFLLEMYVNFEGNKRDDVEAGNKMQSIKNLTDLFAGLVLSYRHSPELLVGLKSKLNELVKNIPRTTLEWKTIACSKFKRIVIDGPEFLGVPDAADKDSTAEKSNGINPQGTEMMTKSAHDRPMSPTLKAQCATIQEMGFSVHQARRALQEKKGNVDKAMNWLLNLSDKERDELCVHKDIPRNKEDASVSPEKSSDASPKAESQNVGTKEIAEKEGDKDGDGEGVWCFESSIITTMKSLLIVFRGYRESFTDLYNDLIPYYDLLAQYLNVEKGGTDREVAINTHTFHAWNKPENSYGANDEVLVAPPWFEGLFLSGIGEHSPGPSLAIKATGKFGGHAVDGSVHSLENGVRSSLSGFSTLQSRDGGDEYNDFQGCLVTPRNTCESVSFKQFGNKNALSGWHSSAGSFRSVYGVPRSVTSSTRLTFGGTVATPNKMYVNSSENYLFVHESPFKTVSSYETFGMSLSVKVSPELVFEAKKFEEETDEDEESQSENPEKVQVPKLFCGIFVLENCGVALTPGMHVVAWRRHKGADHRDTGNPQPNNAETPGNADRDSPTGVQLTDDLKMMVDTGIITKEQAYEMMGVDMTPRSNDQRDKNKKDDESKDKPSGMSGETFSFVKSPCKLTAGKLVKISVLFDGTTLHLMLDDEFVAEAKAEGAAIATQGGSSGTILPASSLSLGGVPTSNPYLRASDQTQRELPYFTGTMCAAVLTIDMERKCQWPLSSMTLGIDLEGSGFHLSMWKKGATDLRNLPILDVGRKHQFQVLEKTPVSLDTFHSRFSNRCQLAGVAKACGSKVVLGDRGGALWFSERHEVTGGFDFSCVCNPAPKDNNETPIDEGEHKLTMLKFEDGTLQKDSSELRHPTIDAEYTIVLRNCSAWHIRPLKGIAKHVGPELELKLDSFWDHPIKHEASGNNVGATSPLAEVPSAEGTESKLEGNVEKVKVMLDKGMDQQAALNKLKSDGLDTKEAMRAIQKALSLTFANKDESAALLSSEKEASKKDDFPVLLRSSLYLNVRVQDNLASVRLEYEKSGCSKVLCRAFNISGLNAFEPTLRYRPKLGDLSPARLIVSFGCRVVVETEFDIMKEIFSGTLAPGLGMWAGIQNGAETQWKALEVTKLAFRGRSIPLLDTIPKGNVNEEQSVGPQKPSGGTMRQKGTKITCCYDGVDSPTNIVQPVNETIRLDFDVGTTPFHKDAWVGMYVPGSKNSNFIKHVPFDSACRQMLEKGTFRVAKKNCWIEFRLFRDVSSSAPVAASGAYFFSHQKIGMPLTSSQLATQARLENLIYSKNPTISESVSSHNEEKKTTSTYLESLVSLHSKNFAKPDSGAGFNNDYGCSWDTTMGEISMTTDSAPTLGYTVKGEFQTMTNDGGKTNQSNLPGTVHGLVRPAKNATGKNWSFRGSWVPVGQMIPQVCHWHYNGPSSKATGKWYKGDISGKWTLKKAQFADFFRSTFHHSGLLNMSNDLVNVCYQNSVMQCLYHSDFIREMMFSLDDALGAEKAMGTEEAKSSECASTNLFHDLKRLYGALTFAQRSSQASHELQNEIVKVFEKGKQQDAHAFLVYLIDNLSTALEKMDSDEEGNFIKNNFEGKNGFIMKRRDTGVTWVTDQDVFVNLNASLPQRYAPITKLVVLTEKDKSTMVLEQGFEILKGTINGKDGSNKKSIGIYRGEAHGLPVTKLKVLTFKHDEGIVVPDNFKMLMTNLHPSTAATSDRIYIAYEQGTNNIPMVEMALAFGGKKAKVSPGFTKVPEALNGGFEGSSVYLSFKKDQASVRDLKISKESPRDYKTLKVNLHSIGNVDLTYAEAAKNKLKNNKVIFSEQKKLKTIKGGPERITPTKWGLYVANQEQVNSDDFEHLRIQSILDLGNDPKIDAKYFGVGFTDHYLKLDVSSGELFNDNVQEALKFISTEKLRSRSVLVFCKDGQSDSVSVVMAYYLQAREWPLKKSFRNLLRMRHVSTTSRPSQELFERLAAMESRKLKKSSITIEEYECEKGQGTRKTDSTSYPAMDTPDEEDEKIKTPTPPDIEGSPPKGLEEPQEGYIHVSYGGKTPVITSISVVEPSDSIVDSVDDMDLCCKLPNEKFIAIKRGNGCPVTNVQLFRAPHDVPRFQNYEVLDLIDHDPSFDATEPLSGIWKPTEESKVKDVFHFQKPEGAVAETMTLVHGIAEGGAFIRGFVKETVDENGDSSWVLNGMSIEDSGVEPVTLSFRENEYSCTIDKQNYKCEKSLEAPKIGVPLTGVMLSKTSGAESLPAGFSCEENTVGNEPANFGSESEPLYLCTRRGGDFNPIAEVSIVWNGIENIPPKAIVVEGNLNITQQGYGAEVILCYTLCTEDHTDAIMDLKISKYADKTSKKGLTKIMTTKSLSMDANLNQNPSYPDFYLSFKVGTINKKKKSVDHVINSSYILEDNKNKKMRINLHAVGLVQCYPVSAAYNLGSPENYRAAMKGFIYKESKDDPEWQVHGEYQSTRDKGVTRFNVDSRLSTVSGVWGRKGQKLSLVKDSYLKLAYQRDYNSDWANGVEIFSGRCRGNRIDDMLAQDVSVLGGQNSYTDEESGKKVEVTRTAMVVQPPRFLIVSIERSKWDVEKQKPVKDTRDIDLEPVLSLPGRRDASMFDEQEGSHTPKKKSSRRYGLYGIVVHSGTTANSGHYYAYARHSNVPDLDRQDSSSSPWMLFNDENIQEVRYKKMKKDIESKKNHSAYLLFYKELDSDSDPVVSSPGEDRPGPVARFPAWIKTLVDSNRKEVFRFLQSFQSGFYESWLTDDILHRALRHDAEEVASEEDFPTLVRGLSLD
jgi:ubiquitin C-terminal hydrolase